jgi:colicin import membrane protein
MTAAAETHAPYAPPPDPGKRASAALTVGIHLLLLGLLFVGVKWSTRAPEPVFAELWAPVVTPPAPQPAVEQPPPRPEPKVEPKPEPKPEPRPEPKAEPKVEKPDIALEKEKERKLKEQKAREEEARLEREKQEKLRKEKEAAAAKAKQEAEQKAKADADFRRAQEREENERIRREAAGATGTAPKAAAPNVGSTTSLTGDPTARAGYVEKIRAKIKGNIVLPLDIKGNPEAVFDVVQLPTGEVLSAKLRKSSGVKGYDEAVERAILKSSPLPRPEKSEVFERNLELKFKPFGFD